MYLFLYELYVWVKYGLEMCYLNYLVVQIRFKFTAKIIHDPVEKCLAVIFIVAYLCNHHTSAKHYADFFIFFIAER